MIWGAIAGAVIGGMMSNSASKKAAKAQERMNQLAIGEQRRQFDLTRQDQAPFLYAGYGAVDKIRQALIDGTLTPQDILDQSPGYQFRLEEGEKGLDRALGSRGMRLSGRALKEFQRYGQNFASTEYDKVMNRLFQLGGYGPNAANVLATTGQNNANAISGLYSNTGNAMAQMYANQNNAIQGTLKNLFTLNQYNNLMNPGSSNPVGGGGYV